MKRIPLVGLMLVTFCAGCVPQQSGQLQKMELSLGEMRKLQAEHTTQLATLQGELRALSGRVEELEYGQQQRLGTTIDSLQRNVSDLQRRVPPPAIVPAAVLEVDEAEVLGLDGENLRLFHEALGNIRLGKYTDALPMLQGLIDTSYDAPWVVYPLFWLGVVFDGSGETRRAVTTYSDLATKFPKHDRAPLALLRLGSAFVRLGDAKAARLSYQKLIAQFPKSTEAQQARERLKGLR